MVEEKDMDTIERAHVAAERLEKANKEREELIKREEEIMRRQEGLRLLGGESVAGKAPEKELTAEEKVKIDARNYFKGGMLEKVFQ